MSFMGSTRLAETEAVDLRLQRYICDHITYGDRDTPVIFSVDFPHYGRARSVIGPKVVVRSPGHACTEYLLVKPLNPEDTETFVANTKDVVEH